MTTLKGRREVVCLKNYRIVFNVVVKVDHLVCFQKLEAVFNQISFVALQLDVWNLYGVNKAYYIVEKLFLGLVEDVQVD